MLLRVLSALIPASTLILMHINPALSVTFTPINLRPSDLGFGAAPSFTDLPTDDPALFGLTGNDVRGVDFDFTPEGNALSPSLSPLTNEYQSIGVTFDSIPIVSNVYGGAPSAPNATFSGGSQIFNFHVPAVAAGIINTSPDRDLIQLFSGLNGTGRLLGSFRDSGNFDVDAFVGGRIEDDFIGSLVITNNSGLLELDELVFEVVPEPSTVFSILLLLGLASIIQRKPT